MRTIRTSKCNTIIKKPSSALFLWLHNSKGWFVGKPEAITRGSLPDVLFSMCERKASMG
jgi:hypothetical protein